MQDLTKLHKTIELVFKHFGIDDPAFAICFTKAPEHNQVFWVANTKATDAAKMFDASSEKIKSKLN